MNGSQNETDKSDEQNTYKCSNKFSEERRTVLKSIGAFAIVHGATTSASGKHGELLSIPFSEDFDDGLNEWVIDLNESWVADRVTEGSGEWTSEYGGSVRLAVDGGPNHIGVYHETGALSEGNKITVQYESSNLEGSPGGPRILLHTPDGNNQLIDWDEGGGDGKLQGEVPREYPEGTYLEVRLGVWPGEITVYVTNISVSTASGRDGSGDSLTASIDVTPEDPSINQPITFDASASEAPDGIKEYRWDFTAEGDTDATGEVVEFTFDKQDTYQVTLTVVGSDGTEAESTQTVEVGINDFEAAVKSKRRVAEDIDDVALYLSELEDVNAVLSGLRESLYDGELTTATTESATTRLRLGEEISRNLLINTSDESAIEGAEDENIAVDTTRFSVDLGISLALSQLALVDVVAESRFGYLIPNADILRQKLDTAIGELISYTFSQAMQSEALSEINSIVQEGYDRILDDEFDDSEDFFAFISDSVSATVANLTIMQTIETGGGFVPRSGPEFALVDAFANVESSLGYLNNELKSESLVNQNLDGTSQGVVDAHDDAEELLNQIASTTDTFLSELNARIDIPGIIKGVFELIDGIRNGNSNDDAVSTVGVINLVCVIILPKASLATTVVQIIGKHVGEFSIRLMMTTHAWGIAGIQRGDPISLADINTLVPDVDSVLEDLDPTENRWGDFA